MRYIELFAGIGGFRLGIERAFHTEHAHLREESEQEERPQGRERTTDQQGVLLHAGNGAAPLCVYANEWDKYAARTYDKKFGGQCDTRDIKTVSTSEIPDHDLLTGGFPCQTFSIAGKRRGFLDETKGTLFFDVARILADKRPGHLVLENVKGLLSHDSGKTFQTILGVLANLGYRVEWQVLNSKNFGVPQNRERVYIVGHLGDECSGQILPIASANRAYSTELSATTVDANYWKGIDNHGQPTAIAEDLSEAGNSTDDINSDRRKPHTKIRRLTPEECERLQGFPDYWTKLGAGDCHNSDTQRYKMCGNAVTVNVVQAVIGALHDTACL